jgi:transposase
MTNDTRAEIRQALAAYLEKHGTPKSLLAKRIGVHRPYIYAVLSPERYPGYAVPDTAYEAIRSYLKERAA